MDQKLDMIEENYKLLKEEIGKAALKSGRSENDVRFMAVTKTVEPVYINRAIELGIDLIGENRVQEFLSKKDDLNLKNVEKRLIGRLQSNKVKKIVGQVDMIESVDSVKIASLISERSIELGIRTDILIEINIGGEESKTGMDKSRFLDDFYKISEMKGVYIRGLMTIPPICENNYELRKFFTEMRDMFLDIKSKNRDNISMDILSMGMSGDFREAIECGSNSVRIGSALFGKRNYS